MTDKPIVQQPARRPAPAVETRPILVDPRGGAPVVGTAQILSGPEPRRTVPCVRTR